MLYSFHHLSSREVHFGHAERPTPTHQHWAGTWLLIHHQLKMTSTRPNAILRSNSLSFQFSVCTWKTSSTNKFSPTRASSCYHRRTRSRFCKRSMVSSSCTSRIKPFSSKWSNRKSIELGLTGYQYSPLHWPLESNYLRTHHLNIKHAWNFLIMRNPLNKNNK